MNVFSATVVAMGFLLGSAVAHARSESECKAIDAAANVAGDRILGYQAVRVVIGQGRLPFHSAPDAGCPMAGVFIIPGDEVIGYVEHQGYTSVMFINTKNGTDAMGWVQTSRLQPTGTGISPKD